MTVTDLLHSIDTVRGISADYMHSVCLGMTRQMVSLWVDSRNHEGVITMLEGVLIMKGYLFRDISPPSA